ncbi:MAG: exopolyphosphatase [Gammaproteobacteria bacterium]|nr:MAG: exopolyphosphatase [Gammaproteobacteria bacterium]
MNNSFHKITASKTPESQENYIAALDMGSNSFHFVYARIQNNQLQVLHKEKYKVQLAQGLDNKNYLSEKAIMRGVNALEKLASTVQNLTADNFRVVATYTLRQAKNVEDFLNAAEKVFPFDIEVISGHEEARLIYQGVSYYNEPSQQRLVIDIGGGSTECVIGKHNTAKNVASLSLGCVSFQSKFFATGEISKTQFNKAILAAKLEIESILKRFSKMGWQTVVGTSGSIKTIFNIINNTQDDIDTPITLLKLKKLKASLIKFGHVDNIKLDKLKDHRRHTLSPSLAILIALVEMLEIKELSFCDYSLREGVLVELLPTRNFHAVQQRTIDSLIQRFNIDIGQAKEVNNLALSFYKQVASQWNISAKRYRNLLQWSAVLHEIGLDINPSSYHKHGQYILTHSDLAGFNQETQSALSIMVGSQRKKLFPLEQKSWRLYQQSKLLKLCVLLRLSVLLTQQRQLVGLPSINIDVDENKMNIRLDKSWLINNPIIQTDLAAEAQNLENFSISLIILDDEQGKFNF